MIKKLKIQKLMCKIQIWGTVNSVLTFLISAFLSCLLWYSYQLHTLVCLLLFVLISTVLFIINGIVLSKINKSLSKQLDDYIFIKVDKNILSEMLLDMKNGVLNITKQNYFLFMKANIDNFALYDVRDVYGEQELKKKHRDNIAVLKKKFPDIKNQYLMENHLRFSAQILITNKVESFHEDYISKNKDRLYGIGQFRCVIDLATGTAILPSFLPKGIGVDDSIFYLKVVNFLNNTLSKR